MKIINGAALVLLLLAGTACAVLLFRTSSQSAQISQLRAQVHAQQSTVTSEQQQVSSLTSQVGSLSTQVSSLNIPTDPLSAYDAICQAQLTNDSTGVLQTYYYPCTNNAQTIPQPSGGN